MKKNFIIVDLTYLAFAGHEYDLHNDFDLTRIVMSMDRSSGQVIFGPSDYSPGPGILVLDFHGISRLSVDRTSPAAGGLLRAVSEIGYIHRDDFGDFSGFESEDTFTADHALLLMFEGGGHIAIEATASEARILSADQIVSALPQE